MPIPVTIVVSRFFDSTREFVRRVAAGPGLALTLLEGNEAEGRAVRALRQARRTWFEGAGPLARALAAAPADWRLPRGGLRAAEDEAASLPWPGLARLVADLVVPTAAAARTVRAAWAAATPAPTVRLHVLDDGPGGGGPDAEVARLVALLAKPPGDLPREDWESIAVLGDACRGRLAVAGAAPPELAEHLARACALDVACVAAAPADAVVLWDVPDPAREAGEWDAAAACVERGGLAALVVPVRPGVEDGIDRARCLLDARLSAAGRVRTEIRGRVVLARAAGGEVRGGTGARAGAETRRAGAPGARSHAPPATLRVRDAGLPVTAVVPVYNDAARVGRAIQSLRAQTYPNLEILVVDDGSTDGTARVVDQHLNDRRVRYLYKEHTGRPGTRNLGVREARGEYVAWLGSDDEALPGRLERQVEAVLRDPGAAIVHADGFFIGPDGVLAERRRYEPLQADSLPERLLAGLGSVCPVLDTSALVRRDLYKRLGEYDPAYPRAQDYEFYVRAAMAGDIRFAHVPLALVIVYRSPPDAARAAAILGPYYRLALRLIGHYGPDRLADPLARHLQEPSDLVVGRHLAAIAVSLGAPPEHPIRADARRYVVPALESAAAEVREEAKRVLDLLAPACGREAGTGARLAPAGAAAPSR